MPLFYQQNINATTRLGIWQITETEDFFLHKVPLQRAITQPHKRLQHLAGRWLLPYLFNDFPYNEILIADTRKPYLPDEQYHFSISHCGNYAAAVVSRDCRCGIDIELVSEKINRIQHKFLHETEKLFLQNIAGTHPELLTVMWSAKEAVFKWYSAGKVDFKNHMQLNGNIITGNVNELLLPFVFKKDLHQPLEVKAVFFDAASMVLSSVFTKE